MYRDTLLITGADARYFELAQGCIRSIRDRSRDVQVRLAFLDMGCSAEQLAWLKGQVDYVCSAQWDFEFPTRSQAPAYLKGVLARPWLRKYFPGHETYIWLDADSWVQQWRAIELLEQGARNRRGIALSTELTRGSQIQFGGLPGYFDKAYLWYEAGHGLEIAAQLNSFPMLNSGAIALHHSAPHWDVWAQELHKALQRTCTTITEQIALNVAIYARGLFQHTELLPAWCNWACHYGMPKWDEDSGLLVEPYLPHTPIGIMHLTVQKQKHATLTTTSGKPIHVSLTYPAMAGGARRKSAGSESSVLDSACLNRLVLYNSGCQKQGFVKYYGDIRMGSRQRGAGRRKVGRKKRRMRAKIRHRK